MDHGALIVKLAHTSESYTIESLWEEEFIEKVAQFSLVVKGLQELDHPLLTKLDSLQFQEKLAFRGRAAAKVLKGLKHTEQTTGGFGSILLDMVASPFRKRIPKFDSALSGLKKGLHTVDEKSGELIVKGLEKTKLPGASLFKTTQTYKGTGKASKGLPKGVTTGKFFTEETAALTEPLSKAQGIVTPALATIGAVSIANSLARRKKMVNEQQHLMKEAAAAIDQLNGRNLTLEEENIKLRTKLAHFERKQLAVEIASEMSLRGMIEDDDIVKTAEKLANDQGKDLAAVKEALAAVQGLRELGTICEPVVNVGNEEIDPLTAMLLDHIG